MPQSALKRTARIPVKPSSGGFARFQKGLLLLFVLNAIPVGIRLLFPQALFGDTSWPEGLLLLLAAGSSLASLTGQVPGQNAILAALVIGGLGGIANPLSALLGVPVGPWVSSAAHRGVPWPLPLLWIVLVLNGRGVGRLMLGRYRTNPRYGFWLMGTTVLLVLLFELGWQPYAVMVKHYWSWGPVSLNWYSTPWFDFAGCAITTLVILTFTTPVLIQKGPRRPTLSYHPLLLWELLSLLLVTGSALHRLWGAAGLSGGQMIAVALLSWVGARDAPASAMA